MPSLRASGDTLLSILFHSTSSISTWTPVGNQANLSHVTTGAFSAGTCTHISTSVFCEKHVKHLLFGCSSSFWEGDMVGGTGTKECKNLAPASRGFHSFFPCGLTSFVTPGPCAGATYGNMGLIWFHLTRKDSQTLLCIFTEAPSHSLCLSSRRLLHLH